MQIRIQDRYQSMATPAQHPHRTAWHIEFAPAKTPGLRGGASEKRGEKPCHEKGGRLEATDSAGPS